jgi:hypothetical protein
MKWYIHRRKRWRDPAELLKVERVDLVQEPSVYGRAADPLRDVVLETEAVVGVDLLEKHARGTRRGTRVHCSCLFVISRGKYTRMDGTGCNALLMEHISITTNTPIKKETLYCHFQRRTGSTDTAEGRGERVLCSRSDVIDSGRVAADDTAGTMEATVGAADKEDGEAAAVTVVAEAEGAAARETAEAAEVVDADRLSREDCLWSRGGGTKV